LVRDGRTPRAALAGVGNSCPPRVGILPPINHEAAELREGSGDEKLDQVLGETDLRVTVELAKAGMA
jgi:hypothetical protein